jgi:hypothetical protein
MADLASGMLHGGIETASVGNTKETSRSKPQSSHRRHMTGQHPARRRGSRWLRHLILVSLPHLHRRKRGGGIESTPLSQRHGTDQGQASRELVKMRIGRRRGRAGLCTRFFASKWHGTKPVSPLNCCDAAQASSKKLHRRHPHTLISIKTSPLCFLFQSPDNSLSRFIPVHSPQTNS